MTEVINRRKFLRVDLESPFFLGNSESMSLYQKVRGNISEDGIGLSVDQTRNFEVGQTVSLKVLGGDVLGSFSVDCGIVHIQEFDSGIVRLGLKFIDLNSAATRNIKHYIATKKMPDILEGMEIPKVS